jgi:hypothetical protein
LGHHFFADPDLPGDLLQISWLMGSCWTWDDSPITGTQLHHSFGNQAEMLPPIIDGSDMLEPLKVHQNVPEATPFPSNVWELD